MSDRIAEIEARLDAAADGPWDLDDGAQSWSKDRGQPVVYQPLVADESNRYGHVFGVTSYRTPDVDLVIHAPTDLRDLLAVAKAAQRVMPICDRCYEENCTGNEDTFCPCDERCHNEHTGALMDLRNALVALDGDA